MFSHGSPRLALSGVVDTRGPRVGSTPYSNAGILITPPLVEVLNGYSSIINIMTGGLSLLGARMRSCRTEQHSILCFKFCPKILLSYAKESRIKRCFSLLKNIICNISRQYQYKNYFGDKSSIKK